MPLVDILILMDPNVRPCTLQVINPVEGDYYGPRCDQRVARSYHAGTQLRDLRPGSHPAFLPGAGAPHTRTYSSGPRSKPAQGTPTEQVLR